MREELRTPFWREAAESLPPAVRRRYLPELRAAERFDIALDAVIALFSRGR